MAKDHRPQHHPSKPAQLQGAPQPPAADPPVAPLPAPSFDPVEAAKVAAAELPGDATIHAPGLLHPPVPAPPPEPATAPTPAPARAKPGTPPPDTSAWPKAPVWRVVKGGVAQVHGHRHRIPVGKLIDEGSYGTAAITALREQGIEFEPADSAPSNERVAEAVARMRSATKLLETLTEDERREAEALFHKSMGR